MTERETLFTYRLQESEKTVADAFYPPKDNQPFYRKLEVGSKEMPPE